MEEQKKVEELYRQLDKVTGECDYYRHLSGTYRSANHNNIRRVKLWKRYAIVSTIVFSLVIILLLIFK